MRKTTAVIAALAVSASLATAPLAGAQELNNPPQPPLGSAYIGSAPISLTLMALGIAAVAAGLSGNVPALREGMDQIAEATRLQPLSSLNLDALLPAQ